MEPYPATSLSLKKGVGEVKDKVTSPKRGPHGREDETKRRRGQTFVENRGRLLQFKVEVFLKQEKTEGIVPDNFLSEDKMYVTKDYNYLSFIIHDENPE